MPFERLFTILSKPWVMGVFLVAMVLSYFYLDQPIAFFFYELDLRFNAPLLNWLTKLGLGGLYLVPLFLLALFFRYIHRNKALEARFWFLWLCVLMPSMICVVLKMLFGRARPDLWFSDHLYGFFGPHLHAPYWSFPSGHTTTMMGFVMGLTLLFPRKAYLLIFFGLLVVLSRIFLTHHYLSDVLTASYLVVLEIGFLFRYLRRWKFFSDLPYGEHNQSRSYFGGTKCA